LTKYFLKKILVSFCARLFWKRVQRYNLFSILPKLFWKNFFQSVFELSSLFESGCKSTTFFWTDKMFLKKNF